MSNQMPEYLQRFLAATREFHQKLTDADVKKLRGYLPPELYNLIYTLTLRPCIDALIVEDKNTSVVLVKREQGTKQAGYYNLPGGMVRWGERYKDAVVRKAREETGLDVRIDESRLRGGTIGIYDDYSINDRAVWIDGKGYKIVNPNVDITSATTVYLARAAGGTLKESAQFFRWDQLPEIIAAPHRQVIEETHQLIKQLYN